MLELRECSSTVLYKNMTPLGEQRDTFVDIVKCRLAQQKETASI